MAIVTMTQGGQSSAAVNGQSLDYITQQVLQQCPGCPDTLAQSVLQNVIRDFYYKSSSWRETIGPYTIVKGTAGNFASATVNLNPVDQYAQCHLVLDAFVYPDTSGGFNARRLQPTVKQRFGNDIGAPFQYYLDGPDTMVLYPVPDQMYGNILYVYMSLMPVINIGQLPNISITHHFDGLFYGTLHRLGQMPGKPWSIKDTQILNEWGRRYRQERMIARDVANRSWSRADDPMYFPNFAGWGSQYPASAGGRRF